MKEVIYCGECKGLYSPGNFKSFLKDLLDAYFFDVNFNKKDGEFITNVRGVELNYEWAIYRGWDIAKVILSNGSPEQIGLVKKIISEAEEKFNLRGL